MLNDIVSSLDFYINHKCRWRSRDVKVPACRWSKEAKAIADGGQDRLRLKQIDVKTG
jgi:hypothetical protein